MSGNEKKVGGGDSDVESVASVRATRTSSAIKIFTHVPPRIDSESYQADIPPLISEDGPTDNTLVSIDWYEGTHQVNNTKIQTKAINDFLIFARNIFEPSSLKANEAWNTKTALHPMETDEEILAYLAKHDYDSERAKFNLLCELGFGKDLVYARTYGEKLKKCSAPMVFHELKNDMLRKNHTFLGAFDSSDINTSRSYTMPSFKRILRASDAVTVGDDSTTKDNKVEEKEKEKEKKRAGSNKQELKKSWLAISKKAKEMRDSLQQTTAAGKPHMSQILKLLKDAAALPDMTDDVGESILEGGVVALGEIADVYTSVLEWTADVHDFISLSDRQLKPKIEALLAKEKDQTNVLKGLLVEAEQMPVRTDEEGLIRNVLKDVNSWMQRAKEILKYYKDPKAKVDKNADANSDSPKWSIQNKPKLEDVNDLLRSGEILPVHFPVLHDVREMYRKALINMDMVSDFLHQCDTIRDICVTRKTRSPRISLVNAQDMLKNFLSEPIAIPRIDELKAVIDRAQQWVKDVNKLVASKANFRALEKLLNEGEKLPVDVQEELDVLREKRQQGKSWLSKLKRSLSTGGTSRSTRKTGHDVERLNLADMKAMLSEGEGLVDAEVDDGPQAKELSKAIDLVEQAEEWQVRVREALTSGDAQSAREMASLLSEAEEMPVVMDEVLLLKAQIAILDWSERAKMVIHKQNGPKFSEVQRLHRELKKIHETLDEELREELQNAGICDEEKYCTEKIQAMGEWQESLKSVMDRNGIKAGTELSLLGKLYKDAISIGFNMDREVQQVRDPIITAERWLVLHHVQLGRLGIECDLTRIVDDEVAVVAPIPVQTNSSNATENETKEINTAADVEDVIETAMEVDDNASVRSSNDGYMDTDINDVSGDFTPRLLTKLVDSAAHIAARFPALDELLQRHTDLQQWMEDVKEMVPKRVCKRRVFEEPEEVVELWGIAELEELYTRGVNLKIYIPNELERVRAVIEDAREWDNKTMTVLRQDVIPKFANTAASYISLSKEKRMILRFMEGVNDAQVSEPVRGEDGRVLTHLIAPAGGDHDIFQDNHVFWSSTDENPFDSTPACAPLITEEQRLWMSMKSVVEQVNELRIQGEGIGIFNVGSSVNIALCEQVLAWVGRARRLTSCKQEGVPKEHVHLYARTIWTDVDRREISGLLKDALTVLSPSFCVESANELTDTAFHSANPVCVYDKEEGIERAEQRRLAILRAERGVVDEEDEDQMDVEGDESKVDEANADEAKGVQDAEAAQAAAIAAAEAAGGSTEDGESNAGTRSRSGRTLRRTAAPDMDWLLENEKKATRKEQKERKRQPRGREAWAAAAKVAVKTADEKEKEAKKAEKAEKGERKTGKRGRKANASKAANVDDVTEDVKEDKKKKEQRPRYEYGIDPYANTPTPDCVYFLPFAKAGIKLPEELATLLHFWVRVLEQFLLRLDESSELDGLAAVRLNKSVYAAPGSAAKKCQEEVDDIIQWGDRRRIRSIVQSQLKEEVQKVDRWNIQVNDLLSKNEDSPGSAKLELEEMEELIRNGDRLIYDCKENCDILRTHVKKAKDWISQLQKTGIEEGRAQTQELQQLIPLAKPLMVDLNEHLHIIFGATKMYCICRGPYHGHMIGCDCCEDWYHLSCVGITKVQADRTNTYVCPRCILRSHTKEKAAECGMFINQWMSANGAKDNRDKNLQKLQQTIAKETENLAHYESEYRSLQETLAAAQNDGAPAVPAAAPTAAPTTAPTAAPATAPATASTTAPTTVPTTAPTAAPTVAAPVLTKPDAITAPQASVGTAPVVPIASSSSGLTTSQESQNSKPLSVNMEVHLGKMMQANRIIDACRLTLKNKQEELKTLEKRNVAEESHQEMVSKWMDDLKKLIWPNGDTEVEAGFPQLNRRQLPPGLHELIRSLPPEVQQLECIQHIVANFKQMAWCYRALYCLRGPPTMGMLHRLIHSGDGGIPSGLKNHPAVTHMNNLLVKTRLWKNKSKKLLLPVFGNIVAPVKRVRHDQRYAGIQSGQLPPQQSQSLREQRMIHGQTVGSGNEVIRQTRGPVSARSSYVGPKPVEAAKLITLINEANVLPVSSGLKTVLREQLEYARKADTSFALLLAPKRERDSILDAKPKGKGKAAAAAAQAQAAKVALEQKTQLVEISLDDWDPSLSDDEEDWEDEDVVDYLFHTYNEALAVAPTDIWPATLESKPLEADSAVEARIAIGTQQLQAYAVKRDHMEAEQRKEAEERQRVWDEQQKLQQTRLLEAQAAQAAQTAPGLVASTQGVVVTDASATSSLMQTTTSTAIHQNGGLTSQSTIEADSDKMDPDTKRPRLE